VRKFVIAFLTVFALDQLIKYIFLSGFRYEGDSISLVLVFNQGVAFSMLAFLQGALKYIQVGILLVLMFYFYKEKFLQKYPILSGILLGAGSSNVFDRFVHGGVVDYVYYHGLFNFAIFNFADVMIDVSIALFGYLLFKQRRSTYN